MNTLDIHTKKENNISKDYKKLGFTGMDAVQVIQPMNKLLANYQIHYQKLRNFHWNVRGGDFFELHDKFEELYKEAQTNIDEIAERIRVFGQTPLSTYGEYLDTSEIKEVGTDISPRSMVKEVLSDFRILVESMNEVIDSTKESGDSSTHDLINGFLRKVEKHHWMFSAFLDQK
jgi:starvation-inducible DNA-binding protein